MKNLLRVLSPKRLPVYFLLLAIIATAVVFLPSCKDADTEGTTTPTKSSESIVNTEHTGSPLPELPDWTGDPAKYLRENFPVIDGSTSLIPLEAGVRSDIFDISVEEATEQVVHSSTWNSFYNLLDGKCNVIFTCPLSEEQRKIAEERGIELECVPVAKEGFIFVVNGENPTEELTQDELKGIYSGDITNWSEVGGPDSPIIAYQRNNESGSQNYMIAFMGDTPLVDAPTDLRPTNMAGILDVLSTNDNAVNSIGYSVYAYAADMYGDGDDIKFISVDGVQPSKQTMATGEYPLMGTNYAVFRADEPADSNVRALIEYMTSYDGQLAAANAGYITLEDIGYDYTEMSLTKYSGTGVGGSAETERTDSYYQAWTHKLQGFPAIAWEENELNCLTNKELQNEINAYLAEVKQQIKGETFITAKNGYLSVAVCNTEIADGTKYYHETESAVWDLFSGKRLTVEELFYDGIDIDGVLNTYLREASMREWAWSSDGYPAEYHELKRDFAALPLNGWHLTAGHIYIDTDNPYFAKGLRFSLADLPINVMVSQKARDMSGCFDDTVTIEKVFNADELYYERIEDTNAAFLREDVYPNAKKINDEVREHIKSYFTAEKIKSFYSERGYEDVITMGGWRVSVAGKYAAFCHGLVVTNGIRYGTEVPYPYKHSIVYDMESGKAINWHDMFKDGWQQASLSLNPNTSINAEAFLAQNASAAPDIQLTYLKKTEDGLEIALFAETNNGELVFGQFAVPYEYVK